MQSKFKVFDPKELAKAEGIIRPSIKGEMRKAYSEIHLKITEQGWAAKDVVAWFNKHGIPMTEQLYRVYLNDLDREHGFVRRPRKKSFTSHMVAIPNTALPIVLQKNESTSDTANNSLSQTTKISTNKTEKESKSTDINHHKSSLSPEGELTNEFINEMLKKSKEKE